MEYKFFCDQCSQRISGDVSLAGTAVTCPTCGGVFIAAFLPSTTSTKPVKANASRIALDANLGQWFTTGRGTLIVLGLCIGLPALIIGLPYLSDRYLGTHATSSSYAADANSSSGASHAQREADTRRGFNFGREIGARRAREGFPEPSVDYLDSIIRATIPSESDGLSSASKLATLTAGKSATAIRSNPTFIF
jgi:hypothetical protein